MSLRLNRFAAFSMVELTIALGIASFCLLAILGLLPVGIKSNQASTSETEASSIAAAIAADLRLSAAINRTSAITQTKIFKFPVPLSGTHTQFFGEIEQPSGAIDQNASASANPPPRYRATVFFITPTGKNSTVARLLITWPALADPTASSTPSKYTGSFEAITSIDTN